MDVAQVTVSRQANQTRAVGQAVSQLVDAEAVGQPQHRAGVEVATARGHGQACQRREAHRGVDRAAVVDGGQRAARAEAAGHHAGATARQPDRAPGRAGVREAVETVAAHVPAVTPGGGQRVGGRGTRWYERPSESGRGCTP